MVMAGYTARAVRNSTIAAVIVLMAGLAVFFAVGPFAHANSKATQTGCAAEPSKCGFPDSTNTGVPAGAVLTAVPGKATSGAGWSWSAANQAVEVTGDGATITGLAVSGSIDISGDNVTVNKVRVTSNGGNFGVSLRHTAGVTIENSAIAGASSTTGRVSEAIDDVYGDSTGMVISNNNISNFKTAIQVTTGQVTGNYIHNPGYVSGDHTNGILDVGTTQPLTISHNTILNSLGQTDAVSLDATGSGQTIANKTVTGNLLGGGGYAIYGGTSNGNTISNMTITGNVFSQAAYPTSGQFGPVAYFATGTSNLWNSNTWDNTGQTVPSP
jgi:hypothetical protein